MNNRLPLFLAVSLLFLFSSCKKDAIPTASSEPVLMNKVNVQNLDFEYLTSRAKMDFQDKDQSLSSSIAIRMKKDSAIWVSVMPVAGIEVVRALITQDSIHVINRLEKVYFGRDYSYLKEKFDVDVNFEMVQALILGNYLPAQPGMEKLLASEPQQHLRQIRDQLILDHFIGTENFKLQKLAINDQASASSILVDYVNFEPLGSVPFARNTNIVMQTKEKTADKAVRVNISHNKVSIEENSLSFPFSVPGSYSRK